MEMKTGQITGHEAQQASSEHYQMDEEMRGMMKHLTLDQRKQVMDRMREHVKSFGK